ncbi:MAG: TIGR03118 family protein, partial [Verrucomicrobia bacterium]|nr:TIGR03118 family protein [Verrucomicrobiota bacterium]
TTRGATVKVDIVNFSFTPQTVTINVGDTVEWIMQDAGTEHNVVSTTPAGVLGSSLLMAGQTYSFTFNAAGTYHYECTIHTFMTGTVTVHGAAADQPPTVSISSPAGGTVVAAPFSGAIQAAAADSDGTVTNVSFLANGNLLGSVAQSPFNLVVTNLAAGTYALTAVATDNGGISTTSTLVTLLVDAPPTVSITAPTSGATLIAPATSSIQASATDPDGTVIQVAFFADGALLGNTTQSPFSLTVSNQPAGSYTLTAVATDNNGLMTTSAPITITVTAPIATLNAFLQQNLVSDLPGLAENTDTNLLNPWGIAASPTGPLWVSDNHTGIVTVYNGTGAVLSLVVTIPPPAGGMPPAAPSGMIFNSTSDFIAVSNTPARFIFSTEDGTLSAWSNGTNALLKVDHSTAGVVYKGLAMGASGGSNYLYATDFHNGRIEVFDGTFADVTAAFPFADSTIPTGFAPFGVQNLNGSLYVAYAKQDADKHDDVQGPGNGFVNVFDTAGHLVKRLISNGALNSPWGMVIAPPGFGPFGGKLLVGNFGDGTINVFDPSSGARLGLLQTPAGQPIANPGLWGLLVGNGGNGGDTNSVYLTAGIPAGGNFEDHGLLARVSPLTGVYLTSALLTNNGLAVNWVGGRPPYTVQTNGSLGSTNWVTLSTVTNQTATVPLSVAAGFIRISD